jgi:diaminohydroxyphosphoribosylaminopyrimidine deaminase / 5-amino-6-(5-phosphoribosylamino)uracil reductase
MDARAAEHMRRALALAQLGWGRVHPNPLVGAVIVKNGRVVGEGHHAEYGGAHAEIAALQAAGDDARDATLYVTLEPCAHHGRTPPCTDAIVEAGISEVVYATGDPNPRSGRGADELRNAGLRVLSGVERAAARELNAAFFHVHERGGPYVALKLAISVDGRIAARPGARTVLTGIESTREVHRLRSGFDAILVGHGTAEADDPLLTVREAPVRQPPVRVVVDSGARLDPSSRLVRTAAEMPVWILAAEDADAQRVRTLTEYGVRVVQTKPRPEGLDLPSGLRALADAGARTIFAEGGRRIASGLLDADLVQRLFLFVAPVFLGKMGVVGFDIEAQPPGRWRFIREQRFGADVLLTLDRVAER